MPKELGPLPALFVIMSFGTAFLFPVYLVEASITGPMPITMVSVSAVAFMAIMVSIVSIAWWNIANGIVGPSRAAVFLNLMPVYAAILAISFLGEQLYLYHFGGAVLVCAGIFLVIRR
jgi:drug/metabolite transporter (DMT)-like permease